MEFKVNGNKFVIIGAGRSGICVAKFIAKNGGTALLCDTKEFEQLKKEGFGVETTLNVEGIITHFGANPDRNDIRGAYAMILSPGAPDTIPPCVVAREEGVEIYSEIEFAYSFYKGAVVAITGTNGKTTTTTLTGELFRNGGKETYVGGNIGDPFINYAKDASEDSYIALEISSFQLSQNRKLHPKVAVITNITPDHLDRHKTMENYIAAKARVFENMTGDDVVILNYDDPLTRELHSLVKCKYVYFSLKEKVEGAYLENNEIIINMDGNSFSLIRPDEMKLLGLHNAANTMCASLAAYICGIDIDSIKNTLRNFEPVEHRMEYVATKNGVIYVNDSKGTNPEATMVALDAIQSGLVIILGGYDKHSEFDELLEIIKNKDTRACVVLGATTQKIVDSANKAGYDRIYKVENYEQAVAKCAELAKEGDYVLLSPACASWDMFDSYETRGRVFKELVRNL
ncbi:MAG: UDP-N-acetylmuramoyl-L-alanine--D-glutamate ligase [Anaerofustis stercorihominis]|nr:UDP-N-acetylmuramoyl-L-alanine--D-glutamate ligase [Anaerofustis stercorihominis]